MVVGVWTFKSAPLAPTPFAGTLEYQENPVFATPFAIPATSKYQLLATLTATLTITLHFLTFLNGATHRCE